MSEHWRAAAWLSVLVVSCVLIAIMAVVHTIGLHPDAMGFLP
jgi:hypothetical protein